MSPRPAPPRLDEPLTPEERAWAERIKRVGPHDGPPPALDAKILAAAHAAVAGQRPSSPRRRWPAYAGVAASLVIAVGLAWQLQPLWQSRPPLPEGADTAAAPVPQDAGTLSADVLAAAKPVANEGVASPAPALPPPRQAKTPAPPAVAAAAPVMPPPPPAPAESHFLDEAVMEAADPMDAHGAVSAAGAASQAQSRAAADAAAASRASASERRERATAASPTAFPTAQAERAAEVAAPAPMPSDAPTAAAAPPPAPASSGVLARKAMTASPPPGSTRDDPTLDRIEVSGSRIAVADLPVRDDVRLEPAAWLERIGERRDADDLEGARASLALFRQHHPRIRVPADLRQLDR